jgi:hypothetical protein
MQPHVNLSRLLELAEEVGITVRRVPAAGDDAEHPGGAFIRLKGREMLLLDPTAPIPDQISVVAGALRGREEIENRYLAPEIRRLIDEQQDA